MVGRSRAGKSPRPAAAWRLVAAALIATFAFGLLGGLDAARACPPGAKSDHATPLSRTKPVAKAELRQGFGIATRAVAVIRHCCAGPSSSASSSCQAACCPVVFADAAPDAIGQMGAAAGFFICAPDVMTAHAPPAHFRPPQSAV